MKQRGRPIMAAIFGFLTGLFASISLLAFGIIRLDSFWVLFLPVVGLVVSFGVAMWAPIGGGGASSEPPASEAVDASDG